jgi:four helix bundle protein
LNIQQRGEEMAERVYDLEERLLDYSVLIIRICEKLPNSRAGNHVAGQLIRSGTSALPNHGEAQSAESPSDFIHKIKVALKELRESIRWLRLIRKVPLVKEFSEVDTLISETDELIRIFVKSVDTARKRSQKSA